jgi:hypothetical protein
LAAARLAAGQLQLQSPHFLLEPFDFLLEFLLALAHRLHLGEMFTGSNDLRLTTMEQMAQFRATLLDQFFDAIAIDQAPALGHPPNAFLHNGDQGFGTYDSHPPTPRLLELVHRSSNASST